MPAKSTNPYTDAILSVIGEYKTIKKNVAKPAKRMPKLMQEKQKPAGMPRLSQSMGQSGITMPDEKWVLD